jgi:hypothetical protein
MSQEQSGVRFIVRLGAAALLAAAMSGCVSHPVTFKDAKYSTGAKQHSATVVAVIDQKTLENKTVVHSFMTGIANNWEAQPGDMLKQVADIELPQMFSTYAFSAKEQAPPGTGPGVVLIMTIPSYEFADFHATISVKALSKTREGQLLFEKTYKAEGATQGGKMFWAGAFGMKSAIRQSSLDAYKKIFAEMRGDLQRALTETKTAAN